MRKFVLLCTLLAAAGCASILPDYMDQPKQYESFGSTIERVDGHHILKLEYKTAAVLREEAEHEAAQRRTAPRTSHLPPGGMLYLTYYAATIGAANPQFWEVIIEDTDGNEVRRSRGRKGTPNYTISHGVTMWYDMIIVPLREEMTKPFHVFVYDDISKHSSQFRITPPQK